MIDYTDEAPLEVTPEVGMGITYSVGSDSYPGTISRVSASGKTFWFKKDDFRARKDSNYYGNQKWIYLPDPEAQEEKVTRSKRTGKWRRQGGGHVYVGERETYQDPHF